MTFQKYFGKKAKFLVAIIIAVIIRISISTCQPLYSGRPTCYGPEIDVIYMALLIFIVFSIPAWIAVGFYYLVKFIHSKKIIN